MKRKPWKLVLGVLGTMGLLLGLLVGDAHRRAGLILDDSRAEVAKEAEELRGRDPSRPSCYLETIDGNAWEYYGPALKEIGAIPQEIVELIPEFQDIDDEGQYPVPDEHALHNLFREYGSTLAAFEKGARCRFIRTPVRMVHLESDWSIMTDSLRLSTMVDGAIRHHHRLGADREALSLALTGLAFAQDFGRRGLLVDRMVQVAIENRVGLALRTLLAEHALGAETLANFAAGLDRLEAGRADLVGVYPAELLYLKSVLLDAEWKEFASGWTGLGGAPKPPTPSCRCLFSQRITRAQALNQLPVVYPRLATLGPLPSWQRPKSEAADFRKTSGQTNLLLAQLVPSFGRPLESDAEALLGRTLVRVAVAVAWFEGEKGRNPDRLEDLVPRHLPKLPVCPLTGLPLRWKDGKLWSVGKNLIDDGGVPGNNEWIGAEDGDAVCTVRRRK